MVLLVLQAKMQFITLTSILLNFGIIQICCAASSTYGGEPGCKTHDEIGNVYRHFWDPMRYYRCIDLNMKPLLETCPDGSGFQQSLSTCVLWRFWKWEIPVYPPSCPDGIMCLSTVKDPPVPLYPSEPYAHTPWMPPSSETFVPPNPFMQSSAIINSQVGSRPAWQVAGQPLNVSTRVPGAPWQQLAPAQQLTSVQPMASLQTLASTQSLKGPPLQLPTKPPQILYEPNALTNIQPLSVNDGLI